MDINHLSVSRTQVWESCRLKYKLNYHLHTPSPEAEPPYFLYGSLVHKIAQEYVESKGKRNINDIKNDCLNGVILLEANQDTIPRKALPIEYQNKLSKHLVALMKSFAKFGFDGECEYAFDYDINPPHQQHVNGKIDRLIQKDGKVVIIDYKTTKSGFWQKSKKDIIDDIQLQCYTMVVCERFKMTPENVFSALYYLDNENFIGAQFSRTTLDKCRENLIKIYNEIETSDPDKVMGSVGKQCDRCEFRTLCPALRIIG